MERLIVNLDKAPSKRWAFLKAYSKEINYLLKYYLNDLSDAGIFQQYIETYKTLYVAHDYMEEVRAIATYCDFSENEIVIANLYYDALKFVFGCTAFCVDQDKDRLHARNLDWWTEDNILGKYTKVFDVMKGGHLVCSLVSWPGFIGALSGVRKGAFSITLNAVMSHEAPQFAIPITFLIRDVLERVSTFETAVKILSETPIASDCLLLVVGCRKGENVVIERTPSRYAHRLSEDGSVIVTNEYLKLTSNKETKDPLQVTASERHQMVKALIDTSKPCTKETCFEILSNRKVKMDITVQQMVFHPKTGEIQLKI
jgi:predicted choloylglycine hydrolase